LNGDSTTPESLNGFEKAKQLLKVKQYDDIVSACTEEIDGDGDNAVEALLLRATFYLIMGSAAASDDFDRLIQVLNDLKDQSAEDNYVKKLLSNVYIKRGSYYMQHGKKEEAFENFEAAEKADPNNADVYHHRGQLLILLNELDRARQDFEKSVELRPDFGLSHAQRCYGNYRLAMATQNPSLLHQAMAEFQSIIDKHPNCSEAYALYGQALSEHEDYEEAERLFDKASKLAPTNANIFVHKALLEVQAKNGDIDKSVKIIEKALQIDPRCEFAYEALGTTELQRGNINRALELYEKAISAARTELEMVHLYSLFEAASAQKKAAADFDVPLSNLIPGLSASD